MIFESTAVEYGNGIVSDEIKKIWMRVECLLNSAREERRDSSEEPVALPAS
jgi:hypothetical protein